MDEDDEEELSERYSLFFVSFKYFFYTMGQIYRKAWRVLKDLNGI